VALQHLRINLQQRTTARSQEQTSAGRESSLLEILKLFVLNIF